MPSVLVRSRRFAAILGLASTALGVTGCSLATDTKLPAFTDPAKITYAASMNVSIPAMTRVNESLYTQDLVAGTGRSVAKGDSIAVYYTGRLNTGFTFDSRATPATPFATVLDSTRLIKGWVDGLVGAKVGSTRRMVISPALAYQYSTVRDNSGNVIIPSNSVLVFDVQVVDAFLR